MVPRNTGEAENPALGKTNVAAVVLGVIVGLGIAMMSIRAGESPLWQSLLAPAAAFGAWWMILWTRARRKTSARKASEAALGSPEQPVAVHIHLRWGGDLRKLDNRLNLVRDDTGTTIGSAQMVIAPDVFDPRGRFWLHGSPALGASVALVPDDGRPTLLTTGPIVSDETLGPFQVHPCSDLVTRLLGWEGERPSLPTAASGRVSMAAIAPPTLPEDLVPAATVTMTRLQRINFGLLLCPLMPILLATALRLPLVASIAVTAAIWGLRWAIPKVCPGWIVGPTAGVLHRRHGLSEADAGYVARALAATGFGLAAPRPDQSPVDDAHLAGAPPGWSYPPQP